MSTVGTTTSQTYLPGLTATLTSIVSANLIVNGGAYLPVEQRLYSTGNWTRPQNVADFIEVVLVAGGGAGDCGLVEIILEAEAEQALVVVLEVVVFHYVNQNY